MLSSEDKRGERHLEKVSRNRILTGFEDLTFPPPDTGHLSRILISKWHDQNYVYLKNANVEKMGRRRHIWGLLRYFRPEEKQTRGVLIPGESIRLSFLILAFAEHFLHIQDTGHLSSFFFFSWPCHTAGEILVPQPGIEPMSPTLKARSLNHWESPTEYRTF